MSDGDAELAKLAGQGDMAALEALYRRNVDAVWRYARLRTNSQAAAADIVQETFLRVTRSVRQFKGMSSFSTWLFAVTRSVTVEHARREGGQRKRVSNPAVLQLVSAESAPSKDVAQDEVSGAVRRAVSDLPGAQRDAIVLCELCDFSIREAADVLGWGESRVKVTLFRARRFLREKLKDFVGDAGDGVRQDRSS